MIKSSLSFKDVISHPTGFRWVEMKEKLRLPLFTITKAWAMLVFKLWHILKRQTKETQ